MTPDNNNNRVSELDSSNTVHIVPQPVAFVGVMFDQSLSHRLSQHCYIES